MATIFWNKFNQRKKALELQFVGAIFQALKEQQYSFLNSIKVNGYAYTVQNINTVINKTSIDIVLRKMHTKAAYIESNYTLRYLKKNKPGQSVKSAAFGIGLDDLAGMIDQYFDIYLIHKSSVPIAETTKKMLRDYLIAKVDSGVPLQQAIKEYVELAIDARSSKSKNRAMNIARTESVRSMNFGSLIGAYMSNKPTEKIWITCDDERVRQRPFSHVNLDRNVADLFGSFYNGEPIKFPGDPEAHMLNTAGCRCSMFFREKVEVVNTSQEKRSLTTFLLTILINIATNVASLLTKEDVSKLQLKN